MTRLHLLLGTLCASLLFPATVVSANGQLPVPDYVKVAWIKYKDEFLVRWLPVPGATGYNVYRYHTNTANWVQVALNVNVPPWNVLSFREPSGADPGPVTYAVSALNADGESAITSASVVPGLGLAGTFYLNDEWWPKGYTFVDPSFVYDMIDNGTDGMVELGLSETNFTHGAWHTNIDGGHHLHATNLSPGTAWVTRLTMVDSNGVGVSYLYPYSGTYTLPLTPIDVWEDGGNQTIQVGGNTWATPGQLFTQASHGTVFPGEYPWLWSYTPEPNFSGIDTFQILDNPDGPPVTLTLNVQNINDPPVAYEFTVYVPENAESVFTPPVTDLENDAHIIGIACCGASHGFVTGWQMTNILYIPEPNFVGTDEFRYYAADSEWGNEAHVTVIVTNVNDAPEAALYGDWSIQAGGTYHGYVVGFDADGDSFTAELVRPPVHGTVTIVGTNFFYTPEPGEYFSDNFSFRLFDGHAWSGEGEVFLWIDATNTVPLAYDQSITVMEATGETNWVLNVVDPDPVNHPLEILLVSPPTHGTLVINGLDVLYRPDSNYFGADSFTYQPWDRMTTGNLATVSITVRANIRPLALPQNLSLAEDATRNVTLSGLDQDSDPLTFQVVTQPSFGTLSGTAPNLVYWPMTNFYGSDSFTFSVNDGRTNSNPATISLNVTPVNDCPVRITPDQTFTFAEDTTRTFTLFATDVEGPLNYIVVQAPTDGTITMQTANTWRFTPNANWNGTNTLRWAATDGQLQSSVGTITFVVTPVNDVPVAFGQSVTFAEGGNAAITLTGSDPDGTPLQFQVTTYPLNGSLSGCCEVRTYTPYDPNFNGSDSFVFRVYDGVNYSATATVSITVTPVNDAPVADSKSVTTAEDQGVAVALTGSDADGDTLSFSVVTAPAHGTLLNGVYTPAANYFGSDSFTYRANDAQLDSAVATVSITITAVNDAPVANAQSLSTAYNTAVNIGLTGSDVEGSALTFTVVTSPANGALSGTGANRTFTPNIGWSGTASFTFKVNDGALDSATATVTITVAAPTGIPGAPSALTATAVSQTQINLSWTDNSNNEDGFKIERSPNGSSSWAQVATVGPNVTSYSNTGLSRNTRYYYRVRSYNVLGNSAYSNTANTKTLN